MRVFDAPWSSPFCAAGRFHLISLVYNDLKFKAIMWLIYARETERESKDEGEEMELD